MHPNPDNPKITPLCPADGEALDALLESRAAAGGSDLRLAGSAESQELAQRKAKVGQLLGVLARCPAEAPPADLRQRTLERIALARQRERFNEQIGALSAPTPAFRWGELITVAAMLMIGTSLLWPMLSRTRAEARRVACATNLAAAGMGLGNYAADFGNVLPRGQVKPGSAWNQVGQSAERGPVQSNSAHAYLLVRQGFVTANSLACPENPYAPARMSPLTIDWPSAAAVSYSYQNQYRAEATRIDRAPRLAVFADKNPLFAAVNPNGSAVRYQPDESPTSASQFHRRLGGQNILDASGTVFWTLKPMIHGGDNIWLATGVEEYKGTETPAQSDDSFLVP